MIDHLTEILLLSSKNENNIKIKYDLEMEPGTVKVLCPELDIEQEHQQNNCVFKCKLKKYDQDSYINPTILVTCHPLTKINLNLKHTKQNVTIYVDNDDNAQSLSKQNTLEFSQRPTKTKNTHELVKQVSNIQVHGISELSELSIVDTIGINLFVDTSTTTNSRLVSMKYQAQPRTRNAKIFICSFAQPSNSIHFTVNNPQNLMIFTNNEKSTVNWDPTTTHNFTHIHVINQQIYCKPTTGYVQIILEQTKRALDPIIQHLLNLEKYQCIQSIIEFIAIKTLQITSSHLETINKQTTEMNTNIQNALQIAGTQKILADTFVFIASLQQENQISAETFDICKNSAFKSLKMPNTNPNIHRHNTPITIKTQYNWLAPLQTIINYLSR